MDLWFLVVKKPGTVDIHLNYLRQNRLQVLTGAEGKPPVFRMEESEEY
jgi:hypothetical protein